MEASPHMLHWQRRCQPPPPFPLFSSPTHHPWLKECSGKRGTRDRRSEALIRNRLCVVLLVSHLLCSPHQEWSGLWWISTKRFEPHKERQFSQVCYLKPGHLGIQFSPRGSLWCLSVSLAGGLEYKDFQGHLINEWPSLKTGVIISLTLLLGAVWYVCCNHGSGSVFPLSYASNHATIIPHP